MYNSDSKWNERETLFYKFVYKLFITKITKGYWYLLSFSYLYKSLVFAEFLAFLYLISGVSGWEMNDSIPSVMFERKNGGKQDIS